MSSSIAQKMFETNFSDAYGGEDLCSGDFNRNHQTPTSSSSMLRHNGTGRFAEVNSLQMISNPMTVQVH